MSDKNWFKKAAIFVAPKPFDFLLK